MQAQNKSGGGFETVEIFVTAQEIDVQEEITADKIRAGTMAGGQSSRGRDQ